MSLGPVASDQLCRTWARILQERHPGLGRIEVSVVDDRQRRPRPAVSRKRNVLVDRDDLQPAGERRRAA